MVTGCSCRLLSTFHRLGLVGWDCLEAHAICLPTGQVPGNIWGDIFSTCRLSIKFCTGVNFIFDLTGYMHMLGLEFSTNFKMISDWETAERQAFVINFDLFLSGCLFHLGKKYWLPPLVALYSHLNFYYFPGQAVWRKAGFWLRIILRHLSFFNFSFFISSH